MKKVFFSLLLILASFNASLSFNYNIDLVEYRIIDQDGESFSIEIDLKNKQEGLRYHLFEGEMPNYQVIKKGNVTNDKLIINDLEKNKEYVVKFFQNDGTSFRTGLIQFYNGQ